MIRVKIFFLFLFTQIVYSQVTNSGEPFSWSIEMDNSTITQHSLPEFDMQEVKAEDAINDNLPMPWRFGYMHSVDYGLNDGEWHTLENGDRIWRLLITSRDALTLNFIFDDFYMPEGGYIYLYNDERTDLLGAYDSSQNQESGILGTWLVDGDTVWIEYYEPQDVAGQGRLHIAKATHGYRNAETYRELKGLNDSGACNLDVDCSIGEDWEELKEHNKKSVGILLSFGSGFCTGALINNVENDGTPYFLTANHCYSNPSTWAFRFGWISPNPVCASNTNSANGPTDLTISGASLRARDGISDFALVEINQPIPEEWDRVYAGWDRSGIFPDFTVGIHHPAGDIMKVCRDDDQPIQSVWGGGQVWEITTAGGGWELGVTEGGSSGSPLFNPDGQIIGQLYGGGAACSGTNDNGLYDVYGRFDISWTGGGTPDTRLSDWLDPNSLGNVTMNPYPNLVSYAYDAGVVSIDSPVSGLLTDSEIVSVTISNFGENSISNFDVSYQLDDGTIITETFTGTIASGETAQYTFNATVDMSEIGAIYQITAFASLSDDENETNDSFTAEVTHLNANDIGVSNIVSPVSGELLSSSEQVTITINNFGGATQYDFDVTFEINGVSYTETVPGPLAPNSFIEYTFNQTVDLSSFGTYAMVAYTSLDTDFDPTNDLWQSSITNINCSPVADCAGYDDGFQLFQLADIDNPSGCEGGYSNFTNLSTDLVVGDTYDVTVTTGYGDQHVRIWIDYNDDFIFSLDEMVVSDYEIANGQGQGSYTETFQMTIPEGAVLGTHIMRIKSNWQSQVPDDACEDTTYGETEDYTVNLVTSLGFGDFELNNSELIIYSTDNKYFTLKLYTSRSELMMLSIMDVSGRVLNTNEIIKNNYSSYNYNLNMAGYETGVYFVKIGNPNSGYKVERIIVR